MDVGLIIGCKVARNCTLSHILFIDDGLCIGEVEYDEWVSFHKVLENFSKDSSLLINKIKTKIILYDVESKLIREILLLFGVKICPMFIGLKYLGYNLKPRNYKINTRHGC